MIKRTITYAALAILTLGFTACQQEEDFAPQEQEQVLRIATRSTSDVSAAETFTRPFTLELWSTADATKHETHSMAYTEGTGWNTVTLQTDQTDATKLADADVMIATGSANAESPLDLNFEHVFAKVTFNVTYDEDFTDTPVLTEIKSGDISCFLNGNKIEMIMNPGTFTAETEILSLKVNGVTQTVKLKDDTDFEAGTHYTYNLTIGIKEVR